MEIDAGKYMISVSASLDDIGEIIAEAHGRCSVSVVSDSNVYPLYGERVEDSLSESGFTVLPPFIFEAGERSKTFATVEKMLAHFAENGMTRSDIVVALGGGVVGDSAGFAAAIYMRGVDFVQLPTSLLAMIDSSVGGKTAVDLPSGKNLAGAFHEPCAVICDTSTLSTLPSDNIADGMAEMIKTAVIGDSELFDRLEARKFDMTDAICRCIAIKSGIVQRDLYDRGERRLLNLGHTVGHAIEALSEYRISHGKAVASGLYTVTEAAERSGICASGLTEKIRNVLTAYSLPYNVAQDFTHDEIMSVMTHDKKKSGCVYNLIVPVQPGKCEIRSFDAQGLMRFLFD